MKLKPTEYQHKEAYCLMLYVSEDGLENEILWNSRDGVTPFCIPNRDGTKKMQHTNWSLDKRVPDFNPPKGTRIFVSVATEEEALALAKKQVERNWDSLKQYSASKAKAIKAIVENYKIGQTPVIKIA